MRLARDARSEKRSRLEATNRGDGRRVQTSAVYSHHAVGVLASGDMLSRRSVVVDGDLGRGSKSTVADSQSDVNDDGCNRDIHSNRVCVSLNVKSRDVYLQSYNYNLLQRVTDNKNGDGDRNRNMEDPGGGRGHARWYKYIVGMRPGGITIIYAIASEGSRLGFSESGSPEIRKRSRGEEEEHGGRIKESVQRAGEKRRR